MAAGESGASGRRVVQTARDSAAESVRRRSQNTEDACATGWRWLQTTAPAASAHRVGNISWVTKGKEKLSVITVSPILFRECVIIDL